MDYSGAATFAGNHTVGAPSSSPGTSTGCLITPSGRFNAYAANVDPTTASFSTANAGIQIIGAPDDTTTKTVNGQWRSDGSIRIGPFPDSETGAILLKSDGGTGSFGTGKVVLSDSSVYINSTILPSSGGTVNVQWNGTSQTLSYQSSTRVLKENIEDIPYGTDVVKAMQPRVYNVIANGVREIGFVAEEVLPLIPEVVPFAPKSILTNVDTDTEEVPISVNYERLTAVLTKALQESIARIEALEQRLTDAGL